MGLVQEFRSDPHIEELPRPRVAEDLEEQIHDVLDYDVYLDQSRTTHQTFW